MPENLEIRPSDFENFIGQKKLVETLQILISSSQQRKHSLDHILFYGPPGTGKTTLANIIANQLEAKIKYVQGPLLEKKSDVLSILANISQNTIIFIDEIHGINKNIEELLYSAMEEFVIDLQIGVDGEKKIMRMKLPNFTLIGASTKLAQISLPLQNRFGYVAKIVNYTTDEMIQIIKNSASILKLKLNTEIIKYIASFSNNTPRIANNLLKRIRDFALVLNVKKIDREIIDKTFDNIGIYSQGLSQINIEYLSLLIKIFKGKSVALDVIASILREHKQTIINIIEPPLIERELIEKTSRGRRITAKGREYLNQLSNSEKK